MSSCFYQGTAAMLLHTALQWLLSSATGTHPCNMAMLIDPVLRCTNPLPLQVRLIVEKLAKRCGFEEVEAAMPEGDTKLLMHIRKERTRKEARKAGAGATEVCGTDSLSCATLVQQTQ